MLEFLLYKAEKWTNVYLQKQTAEVFNNANPSFGTYSPMTINTTICFCNFYLEQEPEEDEEVFVLNVISGKHFAGPWAEMCFGKRPKATGTGRKAKKGPTLVAPGAPRLPDGGSMSAHVTRCLEAKQKN